MHATSKQLSLLFGMLDALGNNLQVPRFGEANDVIDHLRTELPAEGIGDEHPINLQVVELEAIEMGKV